MIRVEERVYKRVLNTPKNGKTREGAISDGTLALVQASGPIWREDPSPEGFVFPSEKLTTPLSLDNLWRRYMQPKLEKIGLGLGDVSGAAKDQRQPVEEGRRRSEGCLRSEGPRARRQHGGLYKLRHGAEASSSQKTRSRRASKTATRKPVSVSEPGLME